MAVWFFGHSLSTAFIHSEGSPCRYRCMKPCETVEPLSRFLLVRRGFCTSVWADWFWIGVVLHRRRYATETEGALIKLPAYSEQDGVLGVLRTDPRGEGLLSLSCGLARSEFWSLLRANLLVAERAEARC